MSQYAEWPKDFATVKMPWGNETINTTWPYIAVSAPDPDDKEPRAMMYHTDDPNWQYRDFLLTKRPDGSYRVSK